MKILVFLFLIVGNVAAIEIAANQGVLLDYETGEVLYQKNAAQRANPSSMTKIMTAYLVFEQLDTNFLKLTDKLKVSVQSWRQEGSRMFLNVGSQASVDDLLRGLIVQSGNDAALTLAEGTVYNLEKFVDGMNKKASELNLRNTHFTNPIGFSDNNNHYMSVYDIAVLSINLIRNFPQYYHYFSIKEFTFNKIKQPNRNRLLFTYQGADGLKTGHTEQSGYGIAVSALVDGRRLVAVVNGANSEAERTTDITWLLDYGFSLQRYKIFDKGEIVKTLPVLDGDTENVNIITDSEVFAWAKGQHHVKTEVIIYREMAAPLQRNERVGEIIVNGGSFNLIIDGEVKKANWFKRMWRGIK